MANTPNRARTPIAMRIQSLAFDACIGVSACLTFLAACSASTAAGGGAGLAAASGPVVPAATPGGGGEGGDADESVAAALAAAWLDGSLSFVAGVCADLLPDLAAVVSERLPVVAELAILFSGRGIGAPARTGASGPITCVGVIVGGAVGESGGATVG
jgi:hypothetical protein